MSFHLGVFSSSIRIGFEHFLLEFIPKYFIFFVAVVNGVFFSVTSSVYYCI